MPRTMLTKLKVWCLVDGDGLVHLMIDNDIGVSLHVYSSCQSSIWITLVVVTWNLIAGSEMDHVVGTSVSSHAIT